MKLLKRIDTMKARLETLRVSLDDTWDAKTYRALSIQLERIETEIESTIELSESAK